MRKYALALPYILHLLPPAAAWVGGSRHVLWFASSLFIAAAVVGLWRTGDPAKRIAASLLNVTVCFANVLLALSFLVQGVGFNLAFFAHANSETLALASVALRPLLLAVLGYLVATLACPLLLGRTARPTRRMGTVAAAAVGGVALNTPAWSFAWHLGGIVADVQSALWVPKPVVQLPAPPPPSDARSLVLIFAESLEATYSRADLFGEDLTPRLTALAASGQQFTNMRQVPLAAWTTGALVAAQCARPLSANAWLQQAAQGVSAAMEGATCLGDLLAAQGYRTVLMTGINIHFGGIETFHAAHGFVERLGFEELSPAASSGTATPPHENRHWLIEDEALFAAARARIDEFAVETEPFALVMTTMDTHGPSGFPSASCGAAQGMRATVRCADRLLAEFIEDTRKAHPNVVVALLTDHLVGTSGVDDEIAAVLASRNDERRLRFAVWGPDVASGVLDQPGTHFDVMPTLMDFLGLSAWMEHDLGASLLRFDSPWFSHSSPLSLRVVHELPGIRLRPGDAVSFEPGPVIALAGHRLLATSKGLSLRNAVFAIRLDRDGTAAGFRTFGHASAEAMRNDLTQWAAGHLLVGVSTHQAFNRQSLEASTQTRQTHSGWRDADLAFFVGAYGTADFATGPLWTRKTVEMPPWQVR